MQTLPPSKRPLVRQIVIQWPTGGWFRKWGVRAIIAIVVIYLAYLVRDIWVPLLLAFLIATVLDPIVDRLEMRGWNRGWAASLIYFIFLAILIGIIAVTYQSVWDQAVHIQQTLASKFPDTSPHGLRLTLQKEHGLTPGLSDFLVKVYQGTVGAFQPNTKMAEYGLAFATNVIWLVVVPIVSFYALRDYHVILAKSLLLIPKERRDLVQTAVAETTAIFGKYLRGMAMVSLLNGVATFALLSSFRIPSALLIGILAVFLYNVPYLGAIAINVLTAVVALLHGGMHECLVVTGIGLFMHHVLFDQIIAPRVLGGTVGLHPILSIIALLIGNLLLGIVGMLLAVPVAACIQIAVLGLVPKLRHEIEMPKEPSAEETVAELEQETLETHVKADATEELHKSVTAAVDNIEEKMDAENGESSDDKPPSGTGNSF